MNNIISIDDNWAIMECMGDKIFRLIFVHIAEKFGCTQGFFENNLVLIRKLEEKTPLLIAFIESSSLVTQKLNKRQEEKDNKQGSHKKYY